MERERRLETDSLTTAHWLAVLLAVATGVIHLYVGLVEGRPPVTIAGVGFFGAVGLFLVDVRRSLLYPVGILYTAVQLPLWYVANAGEFATIGYVDKAIQVSLVVVLVYLFWSGRQESAQGRQSTSA